MFYCLLGISQNKSQIVIWICYLHGLHIYFRYWSISYIYLGSSCHCDNFYLSSIYQRHWIKSLSLCLFLSLGLNSVSLSLPVLNSIFFHFGYRSINYIIYIFWGVSEAVAYLLRSTNGAGPHLFYILAYRSPLGKIQYLYASPARVQFSEQ